MERTRDGLLLRIYSGEEDRLDGRPAHQRLVELALEAGLAGATVIHGVAGFGAGHRLRTQRILRLNENLPLITEIVDAPERVQAFLDGLRGRLRSGTATLERVRLVSFGEGGGGGPDPDAV